MKRYRVSLRLLNPKTNEWIQKEVTSLVPRRTEYNSAGGIASMTVFNDAAGFALLSVQTADILMIEEIAE